MGYTQSIVKIIELVFHVHVGTFACCFFRVVEAWKASPFFMVLTISQWCLVVEKMKEEGSHDFKWVFFRMFCHEE